MTYDYDLYTPTNTVGIGVWGVIAATLAIVGGLVVYFVFLNKSNEDKYKGFAGYLYEFLSFKNSIGRTDLGGNTKDMIESINKIKHYDDSIIIYPGHGEYTTLSSEKENNEFFNTLH